MTSLWQWLTDRWRGHQAFKPRGGTMPHVRSQAYMPLLGIAKEAYWRSVYATHGAKADPSAGVVKRSALGCYGSAARRPVCPRRDS
jgi:hypothetical protein